LLEKHLSLNLNSCAGSEQDTSKNIRLWKKMNGYKEKSPAMEKKLWLCKKIVCYRKKSSAMKKNDAL